jgi:hypothetical protein
MDNSTLNCWEAKNCGREPNGEKVPLHGVCPVSTNTTLDGIHGGKNGGRCCWAIMPFLSDPAEIADEKLCCSGGIIECYECDFYRSILNTSKVLVMV